MTKYLTSLVLKCVTVLALFGTCLNADISQFVVTDINSPKSVPEKTQVHATHSTDKVTETESVIHPSETTFQDSSYKPSQTLDQSESSSIIEGSSQIVPSFGEIQGASLTSETLTESVTQSTVTGQAEETFKDLNQETSQEIKSSVEVEESGDTKGDQQNVKLNGLEVKITENFNEIATDESAQEMKSLDNATQFMKDEGKDELPTEPPVNTPSPPANQAKFEEKPVEVGGDNEVEGGAISEMGGDKPVENVDKITVDKSVTDEHKTTDSGETVEVAVKVRIGGDSGEGGEIQSEDKHEEEGLTFNEWTQKFLAEAEKGKLDAHDDSQAPLPPVKQRKKKNYASQECGAKILASNPEASSPKSVLNSNRDEYMNNPCKAKKWFVIELCEPIQANSVDIASLELFSSQPKKFKVLLSDRYPTKDWRSAGEFDLKEERAVQTFTIIDAQDYFAKFVRVELVEHYGNEHFCPLTIFRVLGIAVYDDDEHHDSEDDDDNDDNDDNEDSSEGTGGSKNLFTSAKDTVINIVKKVLNVESEEEKLLQNASTVNVSSNTESTSLNETTISESTGTEPCVPEANIPTDNKDPSCTGTRGEGHMMEETRPQAALPGIVTKLEDHEQEETTLDVLSEKSLKDHISDCFLAISALTTNKKRQSYIMSKFCEFMFIINQQSAMKIMQKSLVNRDDVRTGTDSTQSKFKTDKSSTASFDSITERSSNHITMATNTENMSATSVFDSLPDKHASESNSVSGSAEVISKSSKTADQTQSTASKITTLSTGNEDSFTHTQTVSTSQTVHPTEKQIGSVISSHVDQSSVSVTENIEPSPTTIQAPAAGAEMTRGATPVLPDDWKPDTKDLIEDRPSTEAEQPPSTAAKQTLSPDTASVHMSSTETTSTDSITMVDPTVQSEPTNEANGAPSNGVGIDDIHDELDVEIMEEGSEQRANTTVIDDKVVVGNGGQQKRDNLSLVRLPVIPSGKRESAIMRLSNRIKVLEQNVSLSNRFLEELSRRYKKQSEDMMKMLNKTMAALHNMSVEADVKNKLHEDEMSNMERRLENLTQTVKALTHNFDNLNRQVTDRQMIWTTIEIIIIVFMLLFLHFRRKKLALPPEVRTLIESMPSKPAATHPQRRNSLSGPATPSKDKPFGELSSRGGLQRFSSETALVSTVGDFPIVLPIDTNLKQGTEGVKKKKKKKQKTFDGRLSLITVGGSGQWDNLTTQSSSHCSTSNSNQSKETSQEPSNKNRKITETRLFKNSKGNQSQGNHSVTGSSLHSSCSLPQTQSSCFGTLWSGWTSNTTTKQRSSSLGAEMNTVAESTQDEGSSFHKSVQDGAKANVGTKLQTKGLTKKPPASGGSKVSPTMKMKIPKISENDSGSKITLEEKWIVKGHKRQKSLPKQHYSSIEAVGHIGQNSSTSHENHKHFDTTPVPYKVQKRSEMKKSISFPVSSENKFEKPPTMSHSFATGSSEFNGGYVSNGSLEECFKFGKKKSEMHVPPRYGKFKCNNDFMLNGHTNGDDYNINEHSGDRSNGLGSDRLEHERSKMEPVVVQNENVKTCQNGSWKNIFGYFK